MIDITNLNWWGIEHAIRGMRNPYESYDKSDSDGCRIGDADMTLCNKLIKGGTEHRKFLRQIFVSMDITAPLYWWKEFDTYKVGTTANSTSTMHKLMDRDKLTEDDFSFEYVTDKEHIEVILLLLNTLLDEYKKGVKACKYELIQMLPSSFNQTRTVTLNYENLLNICKQRTGHYLKEWLQFCNYVKERLPYLKEWAYEL